MIKGKCKSIALDLHKQTIIIKIRKIDKTFQLINFWITLSIFHSLRAESSITAPFNFKARVADLKYTIAHCPKTCKIDMRYFNWRNYSFIGKTYSKQV